MHLITMNKELFLFKYKYERKSGLKLPLRYLKKAKAYSFVVDGQIVGGFILNSNLPLRTADIFVSEESKNNNLEKLNKEIFCEVCCFWMDRKFQKEPFYNSKFWLQMAKETEKQDKRYILYGTNSKGLANMYGYPKKSLLFHNDKVDGKETFIFLSRRDEFYEGVKEILYSRLNKKNRKINYENKFKLENELRYEISK